MLSTGEQCARGQLPETVVEDDQLDSGFPSCSVIFFGETVSKTQVEHCPES